MKITVFTSNQPRHIHLIKALSQVAEEVFAVQEVNTIFPGQIEDFYKKSPVMQEYFLKVMEAEKKVFGDVNFLPSHVHQLPVKMGDLNNISLETLEKSLQSDFYVVFGSSYIKSELIDFLIEKKCINLHMGISPYYRGTATNFWPLYEKKPEYIGATIHRITKGLDSGAILYHTLPKAEKVDGFELGMRAVLSSHEGLIQKLEEGSIFQDDPIVQDKSLEIRYSKKNQFDDNIAQQYLSETMSSEEIFEKLQRRENSSYIRPIYI